MSDTLSNGGYPALAQAASAASRAGQRGFFSALRLRLAGLTISAIGGGVLLGLQLYIIGGSVALAGFGLALIAELYTALAKPDRRWYEGRAAAESVKTLAWRYAVCGEPFASSMSKADADKLLVVRVGEVLSDLRDLDLESSETASVQISTAMRELRAASFTERKRSYSTGRVENQRVWYASKARHNRAHGQVWTIGIFIAEGVGFVGGVLTVASVLTLDLLAIIAALIAMAAAWTQARQYATLATSYGIAAQELASIVTEADGVTEKDWAEFVGNAEEAISREHTLWRASRGVRMGTRRS